MARVAFEGDDELKLFIIFMFWLGFYVWVLISCFGISCISCLGFYVARLCRDYAGLAFYVLRMSRKLSRKHEIDYAGNMPEYGGTA